MVCITTSCSQEKITPQLAWGKYYLWNAPDSAYHVLQTISSPEKLPEKERNLYALLLTQAMHRSGRKVTSDSLVNVAVGYYSQHGTPEEKASAFLSKGYILEDMGKDDQYMHTNRRKKL